MESGTGKGPLFRPFSAARRAPKRIVYVQYTNPAAYPPLEHGSRILATSGWRILFLGIATSGPDDLRFAPHSNIITKRLWFCAAGAWQKLHYLLFCIWVLGWVLLWKPRWVYASDPLSCPIALALSWIPGLRIIYHEHDSPDTLPRSRFQSMVLWSRKKLARKTACCVLPNHDRARRFRGEHPHASVHCVWNCPALDEVASGQSVRPNGEFWLLYHGSFNAVRLPLTVLHAMTRLPANVKLRLVGYETIGHGDYLTKLAREAKMLGLEQRIEIIGALPERSHILDWCMRSHVGLALMPLRGGDFNERTMAGASNKAFDYLSQGMPVLVSDCEDWRSIFVEPGYGLACIPDDPASIAAALDRFVAHPQERMEMGERGRRRIEEEWNYETEFAGVLDILNAEPKVDLTRTQPRSRSTGDFKRPGSSALNQQPNIL